MIAAAQIPPAIPFNPLILQWARVAGGYSYEDAAKASGVKPEKVSEWESSISKPTVRQARSLAGLYKRPFLEFFAREIPTFLPTNLVPDFRLNREISTPKDERLLTEVQSWAETQRLNALDLFEILGEVPPKFGGGIFSNISMNPEIAADEARRILGPSIETQLSLKSTERQNFAKIIQGQLETNGILVFKNSELKECGARGMCIFATPLPIIVTGDESAGGRVFTIVHELAHIVLQQSAISGTSSSRIASGEPALIEKWCNRFAGAFLMPKSSLVIILDTYKNRIAKISDADLTAISNRFAVSRHAMMVRLVELGHVDENYYWQLKRPQFLSEEANVKSGGRSLYYGSRYRNKNGDLYTGLVLEALSIGRITNHNAGEFMGIKNLRHLSDIRANFGK